jgi:hypothetical protein
MIMYSYWSEILTMPQRIYKYILSYNEYINNEENTKLIIFFLLIQERKIQKNLLTTWKSHKKELE